MSSVHQDDALTVPIKINLNYTLLTMDNNPNPTDNGSNQPPTINQVQIVKMENSSNASDNNILYVKNSYLYEQYVNAFAFSEMVKNQNTTLNKKELQQHAQNSWREIRTKDKNIIQNIISELLKTPVQPSFPNFSNFSSKNTPATEREPSPNIIPEPSNDTQFP
ncbi:hypothetical protein RhiirC2_788066 [Rhizophagus irregularis]|uniref:Uncharacterized protein n=1 Tax=Rhizophagus irregularis TaxID=588596 RepID=A0A2N1MQW0_9GLOM|nr:hypothetical protein RhiirC2_788066 [Rhizophagus irregularis]